MSDLKLQRRQAKRLGNGRTFEQVTVQNPYDEKATDDVVKSLDYPIDNLYSRGLLTNEQKRAADELLKIFTIMQLSPKRTADMSKVRVDESIKSTDPSGSALDAISAYGSAMKLLSHDQKEICQNVCCFDMTIKQSVGANTYRQARGKRLLEEGLDALAKLWGYTSKKAG